MRVFAFAACLALAALAGPAYAQQAASDPAVSAEFLRQFKSMHADAEADLALALAREAVTARELQAARAELDKLHAAPSTCSPPTPKAPPT